MGSYDMFLVDDGEYEQIKAFDCRFRQFVVGDKISEVDGNYDIFTPNYYVLKIREGVYSGWNKLSEDDMKAEPELFGYKIIKFDNYKADDGVKLIDKYGQPI